MKKILIACMMFSTLGLAENYTQADRILDLNRPSLMWVLHMQKKTIKMYMKNG